MIKKSEIRKHYFMDRYVVFAPKRDLRPRKIHEDYKEKKEISSKDCFFCPDNLKDKILYSVGDEKNWKVAVIENKFPSLSLKNKKAYGKQEIVIETPKHNKELSDLSVDHIVQILKTYNERIIELRKIKGIEHVIAFKNDGGKAGASIPHAHSQIFALPMVPPKVIRESNAIDDYYIEHKRCPYCDVIRKELKEKKRIVYKDDNVVAFCPYASTSPYGVWIMPLSHRRNLVDFSESELTSLAKAIKKVTGKLDANDIAYNYFLNNSLELENHHFRMKVTPRMNIWAGLEIATSLVVNPVFPEDATKFYNKK